MTKSEKDILSCIANRLRLKQAEIEIAERKIKDMETDLKHYKEMLEVFHIQQTLTETMLKEVEAIINPKPTTTVNMPVGQGVLSLKETSVR